MKDIKKKEEPAVSGGATLADIIDDTSPIAPIIGTPYPTTEGEVDYPPAPCIGPNS
jgi:hypothetical protein